MHHQVCLLCDEQTIKWMTVQPPCILFVLPHLHGVYADCWTDWPVAVGKTWASFWTARAGQSHTPWPEKPAPPSGQGPAVTKPLCPPWSSWWRPTLATPLWDTATDAATDEVACPEIKLLPVTVTVTEELTQEPKQPYNPSISPLATTYTSKSYVLCTPLDQTKFKSCVL